METVMVNVIPKRLCAETGEVTVAGDLRSRRNPQITGLRESRRRAKRVYYWPAWSTMGVDTNNGRLLRRLKARLRKEWGCAKCKQCGGPAVFTPGESGSTHITPLIPRGALHGAANMSHAQSIWSSAPCRNGATVAIELT